MNKFTHETQAPQQPAALWAFGTGAEVRSFVRHRWKFAGIHGIASWVSLDIQPFNGVRANQKEANDLVVLDHHFWEVMLSALLGLALRRNGRVPSGVYPHRTLDQ